jgi:hypothetical protein
MRKTNPKTIETLEQKIVAWRQKMQEAYNICGYTDSVGILDAAFSLIASNWTS